MILTNKIIASNAEPEKQAHDLPPISRFQTIVPEQLRAARSLLNWSRNELAKKAGMSAETIKNIEHGIYLQRKETIIALIDTFAHHGVQFIHYETLITTPSGNGLGVNIQALTYAGVVRVTSSVPEIKGEVDD